MCARAKAIIHGLLNKINVLQEENARIKAREKKWIFFVFICVIVIWFLLFGSGDVET